jgi:hypothetical protein
MTESLGQADLTEGSPDGSTEVPTEAPKHTLTINGVEVQVDDEELRSGYMRQADYTRKTQALSASQKELEQAAQIHRALQTNPEATLQYLASEYGVDVGAFEADEVDDDPTSLKIRELEQTIATLAEREVGRQVDAEINDIRTKYDVSEEQLGEVMAHATRTKQSLKNAYRDLFFDDAFEALKASRTRKEAEQQIADDKVNGGASAVHLGAGGAAAGTKPQVERPKTLRDAYLLAKQGISVR